MSHEVHNSNTKTSNFLGLNIVGETTVVYTVGDYTAYTLGNYNDIKISATIEATLGTSVSANLAAKVSYDTNAIKYSLERTGIKIDHSTAWVDKKKVIAHSIDVVAVKAKAEMLKFKAVENKVAEISADLTSTVERIKCLTTQLKSEITAIEQEVLSVEENMVELEDIKAKVDKVETKVTTAETSINVVNTLLEKNTAVGECINSINMFN